MYYVYRHTSPVNKVYVGITKQKPERRWLGGLGYRTQKRFYRAILKYGWDNFTHEILYSGLSLEEAEDKERELILFHRSFDKNFGYNIEFGGVSRKEVSAETREKLRISHTTPEYLAWMHEKNTRRWSNPDEHKTMRERFTGERNPMYGRKLSDEHKAKLLAASRAVPHRALRGEENPMYGKHLPEEAKRRISEANWGAKNGRSRKILCVETGVIYGSIRDAYRETGVHFSSISKCCCGVNHRAGGYHWRYVEWEEV